MPPLHAQVGAFVTGAQRAAQWAMPYAQAANQAAGRMFMQPSVTQPFLENVRGPGGRFTAEQVNRGGNLLYPTFTEGLATGVQKLAQEYPRVAQALAPAGTAATAILGPLMGGSGSTPLSPEDQARYDQQQAALRAIDAMPSDREKMAAEAAAKQAEAAKNKIPLPSSDAPATTNKFIQDKLAAPAKTQEDEDVKAALAAAPLATEAAPNKMAESLSRQQRIKEGYKDYQNVYKELLGDTKDDMRVNAMLMLADAGFKYASISPKRGQSEISVLAEAVSGLPRGFAGLLAQAKDREIKVNTAALGQAVSDVQEQDKFAQQIRIEMLRIDKEILKEKAKNSGGVLEDGGAGMIIAKTPKGGFLGFSIDPKSPTVQSAINSPYTLRQTDNPFVENLGTAPTTVVEDKAERNKLVSTMNSLNNGLALLENMKGIYASAYGPGAWVNDKLNNLFVPILPTAVLRPDLDLVDAKTRINTGLNNLTKMIASANDGGRVAVQEQEWVRKTAEDVSNPTAFFQEKELAAKQFAAMETMLRNSRQQVMTQLGYEKDNYVMRTPNTGTKSDPFVIPADPQEQQRMFTFLSSTIGKTQDPRAMVYVRKPNGETIQMSPSDLRGPTK